MVAGFSVACGFMGDSARHCGHRGMGLVPMIPPADQGPGAVSEVEQRAKRIVESCHGSDYAEVLNGLLALVADLRQQQEQLQVKQEMTAAQLRGWQDFFSGQPREMPYRGSELTGQAKESQLNFAWTVGYDAASEADVFKLMVGRADRSAALLEAAEASLTALRREQEQHTNIRGERFTDEDLKQAGQDWGDEHVPCGHEQLVSEKVYRCKDCGVRGPMVNDAEFRPFTEAAEATGAAAVSRLKAAEEESERLRVQLAGCVAAALGNTREALAKAAKPGDYGYSASYQEVINAVTREVELREERDAERDSAAHYRKQVDDTWDAIYQTGSAPDGTGGDLHVIVLDRFKLLDKILAERQQLADQSTALSQIVQEMDAAHKELCERALSPDISAEVAAYMGAPGRTVKNWRDRIDALLISGSARPHQTQEQESST